MSRGEFDVAGTHLAMRELEGETVLFTPREYIESIETTFGTKDAVRTDLVVLSRDNEEHYDVLVFQGGLIGTLKRQIKTQREIDRNPVSGVVTEFEVRSFRRTLGKIGKGDAKKGQNAPFEIQQPDEQYLAAANAYVAENPVPAPEKVQVNQYIATDTVAAAPAAAAPAAPAPVAAPAAPTPASELDAKDDPFAV